MAVDSLANLHQKVAQISPNSIFTVDVDFYLKWHFFITSHDSHKDWRLIPSACRVSFLIHTFPVHFIDEFISNMIGVLVVLFVNRLHIFTKFFLSPLMKNLIQKFFFATCVIEFLQSNDTIKDLEYEDLLNYMNQIEPPDGIDIGVNVLNKHAAYIVERHDYGLHPIINAMEVAVDTAAQVAKGYRLEAV